MQAHDITWPAEWAQQKAVLIVWPHKSHDWRHQLSEVTLTYVQMANAIIQHQALWVVAYDQMHQAEIASKLGNSPNIHYILAQTNDTWVRDTGPISIKNRDKVEYLNFRFNAWGAKYDFDLDNKLCDKLSWHPLFAANMKAIDIVLEGGSIESDGKGTLMTTKSCLMNTNRNQHCTQSDIESMLQDELGTKQFIWLDCPSLPGDDTDGHIDTLARFCPNNVIAYLEPTDTATLTLALREQLGQAKNSEGEAYELVPLPYCDLEDEQGNLLPASYANFLIINQAVLIPQYGTKLDDIAFEQIQRCFPSYKLYRIDAKCLIKQGGSIHCVTMQILQ